MPIHRLLRRQIDRFGLSVQTPPDAGLWIQFIERVSATYVQSDESRHLSERSMEISSREMHELHEREHKAKELLEERVRMRTAELKQLELAARDDKERLQRAIDASRLALWDYDLISGKVYLSETWSELLGGPHVPTTTTFAELVALVPEQDRFVIVNAMLPAIKGERRDYQVEHRVCKPDGNLIWIRSAGQVIERDPDGRAVRALGTNLDITDRKLTDIELRIAATAFESQEGMVITDAAKVILRVNRAFSEITGYSAEEAVGKTPSLLKSGRHDADFYAAMWASIASTGSWHGEIWNRRKSGEVYPEWLSISVVIDERGQVTNYVAAFSDITSRKAAADEIRNLAFYDSLTQLPNRRLLRDRLEQALASGTRNKRLGALLFIDLDNFKNLNDTLGHSTGDLLLQQVSERLTGCIRDDDTVARLGGDEFVVMLKDLSQNPKEAATQAETVGEKILVKLNETYQLASHAHHSAASIGITLFGDRRERTDELLKQADLAMYHAKSAGRNTLRFFEEKMQAVITTRAELEAGLREALLKSELQLYYQAQMVRDCLTGCEVLVRWRHPQRGLISPLEFIPLAEETGLILPLGQWVLETACAQLTAWAAQPEMAHLTIAINVSARQFHHRDFVDQVLAVLEGTGAKPERLKLELTESLMLHNVEDVIVKMAKLKARGVSFSLDDFGTGYSSLSYLKRLPLSQLKIDQSFVRNILTDPNDAAIAKMVIALGESMGLAVIAEGVEIEAQRDFLARNGCHAYQGYLFSRPLPLEEFEVFVKRD